MGSILVARTAASMETEARALRRTAAAAATVELLPGSAYVLAGAARYQWQHSIAPVRQLRYSVTFRTLARRGARPP